MTYSGAKEQLNDKCFSKHHSFHIQQHCIIILILVPVVKDLICRTAEMVQCMSGKLENEVKEQKQKQENTDDLEKNIYII